ncbi:MAG: hypothetical protein AB2807_11865 [Candidatus Sedimenticola endophacoides]
MTKQSSFRIGKTIYRIAGRDDDTTLRTILRDTVMPSWVILSAEHEPSYFRSAELFGQRETLIAERDYVDSVPIGMCSWTAMQLYIDEKPTQAGYLGELRVLPEFRTRPGIVRNGFKAVRSLAPDCPRWFTSIAVDNIKARRLLEAGLNDMPHYHPLGEMVTLALPASLRQPLLDLQPCTQADIPKLVDFYNHQSQGFQYAPVLSESWIHQLDGSNGLKLQDFYLLRHNNTIKACFALWDQRCIKQTVVRGYRFPLDYMRCGYNVLAYLSGRLTLPPVGQIIDHLFIAFLAISPELNVLQFRRLINSALTLTAQRRINCAMLGLAANNPLLKGLWRYRAQTYRTCIEAVTWNNQEVFGIPHGGRIIQPEIALL